MDRCDVLIAGGGPAGAACAWALRRTALDVLVVDKAIFPRDKVCGGWITPPVLEDLEIDPDEYRNGRTFQPITAFRVGVIGSNDAVDVDYNRTVSFGIRRCEFDHYLLQRSGARLMPGTPITSLRRESGRWVVNDTVTASMLVGAGGHFCPVARMLNGAVDHAPVVRAQEVEFALDPRDRSFAVAAERPALYFCRDLAGYGWCFRKQSYLNIGFGRIGAEALPRERSVFLDFLKANGTIPPDGSWRWRGHAYLLGSSSRRQTVGEAVLLVGDAAGLAYPQSGEGIRPAIESGLIGAAAIVKAAGRYTVDRLEPYEHRLRERFEVSPLAALLSRTVPTGGRAALASRLLASRWFVRTVVLDRWFLHRQEPAPENGVG